MCQLEDTLANIVFRINSLQVIFEVLYYLIYNILENSPIIICTYKTSAIYCKFNRIKLT